MSGLDDFARSIRSSVRELKPYQPGKPIEEVQRELGLSRVVKLASNEYPDGPFPEVVEVLQREATQLNRYPDPTWHELTRAVAKVLRVEQSELFFGNGTNEILELLIHMVCRPGRPDQVVFGHPSFPIYHLLCQSHFDSGKVVPLDSDFVHDLPAMAAAVTDDTRLLFVCNPNNPTGTYVPQAELVKLLDSVPDHVLVVLDEAYVEFATAEDFPRFFELRSRYPNLVTLRTFSKAYSLAGARIGYMVGPPEIVELLQRVRQPFNVNRLSQVAATVAIAQQHRVEERCRANHGRRAKLAAGLEALGCRVVPSQANFMLAFAPVGSPDLFPRLLREGVIVRPMHSFGMKPGSFRVTVGLDDENELFLRALERVLAVEDVV